MIIIIKLLVFKNNYFTKLKNIINIINLKKYKNKIILTIIKLSN